MARNQENNETIDRSDLDTILEVNKKAIEISAEVSNQNEEVIEELKNIYDKVDEIEKTQTKVYLLLIAGVVNLIIQVVQIFRH